MIEPTIIDALVAAGCTAEQLAAAVKADAALEAAKVEARKAKGRARFQRWKETHSNDDKRSRALAADSNALTGGDVRVEDNLLPSEIEPQVKEEKKARRASRLSADWVLPVEWRDDGRKAGLSEAQIDAEAVTMLDWSLSSPNGSKLDWRASWRTWCRRAASDAQRPRAGPRSPRQAPIDHFRTYASEINGQDGNDRSIGGDWDDAPGLPVRTIEHHG